MPNKFCLLLVLLQSAGVYAQSITQQTLSSAGGQWSKEGVGLQFTLGGLAIKNFTSDGISIHTGFLGKGAIAPKKLPLVAGTTSISANAFCAAGAATLRATGYTPGNQYQWQYSTDSFSTDVRDLALATAPDSANTGQVATTTYYRLKACCNSVGMPVYSTIVTLAIRQQPPAPVISPSGTATFCAGGKATLSSSAATGNQWFNQGVAIAGATGQTYEAIQSGSYAVKNNVNNCLSEASNATSVTALPIPPTPTISQSGKNLISSAKAGNQWYLEGIKIEGATDTVYKPVASGNYTVQVATADCTSQPSNSIAYVLPGAGGPPWENHVALYPNPFSDKIVINNRSAELLAVQFFDASGRLVLSKQVSPTKEEIATAGFAKGLYFIKITSKTSEISMARLLVKL